MRSWPAFLPNGYLLVTVTTWGLNFVAVKECYKQIEPPALALIRFIAMWAGLVVVCLIRKESLKLPKADALRLLYLGFVSMGVYMLLFLEGMKGSAAGQGAILLQMSPVFTALFSAAAGQEKLRVDSLFGTAIALAGTALVIYARGSAENNLLSNVVVVVAAATWAYSVILMRPLLLKYSPLTVLTASMGGGLPVMLVYGLRSTVAQDWLAVTPYTWLMFVHFSIISGVIAFLCFYQGVRQVGGPSATLYQFLVPGIAMAFSALIEGSRPSWIQLAGLVVVLAGVGLALRARYRAGMLTPAVPAQDP